MAHAANIISQIKLPNGVTYEIHDPHAFHAPGDIGISGALIFKGVLADADKLPAATNLTIGHVYLIGAMEYVGVEDTTSTPASYKWEKLGNIHDAASSSHTHAVQVTGHGHDSLVTGYIVGPKVEVTEEKVTGTAAAQNITTTTKSAIGINATHSATISGKPSATVKYVSANTTLSNMTLTNNGTTNVISAITTNSGAFVTAVPNTTTSVVASVSSSGSNALTSVSTNSKAFITAINPTTAQVANGVTTTTANAVTGLTAVTPTAVNVPNVTSWGSASTWTFNVSSEGVLTIAGQNGSAPTTGTNIIASRIGTDGKTKVASSTPTTALFVNSATPTMVNVVNGFNAATTSNAITSVNSTNSNFLTSVSSTPVDVINSVSVDTANAITVVNGTTVQNVWKAAKFSGTPSAATTLALNDATATGRAAVVTAVDKGTLAASVSHDNKDEVKAVITATANASTVTLEKNVVTEVNVSTDNYELKNGLAKGQTWEQVTGSTGAPNPNT